MITNHPNGVSPPLSAIRQTLIFYEAKYQAEEEKSNELERLLKESQSRRDRYKIMVDELNADQAETESSPHSRGSGETLPASSSDNGAGSSTSYLVDLTKEIISDNKNIGAWVKPDVSWLELIRKAIRQNDDLVSNKDVADFLGMDEESRKLHHQTLSGSMAAYRSTGHLIGIQVFKPTPNGKTLNQYFTGLPEFFEDVESKKLKPEYREKMLARGKAKGFFLSEAEALAS